MLKFISIGSAFNSTVGNNSAYIKVGNTLLIIDVGSSIYSEIKNSDLLNGIENIFGSPK